MGLWWRRVWPAVAGGILMGLAYAPGGVAGLAWVAPAFWLGGGLASDSRRGTFGCGFIGGAVFFLVSLSWLFFIPFPAGAVAGWLSLSFYCALYPAFWVWGCGVWLEGASKPCPTPARWLEKLRALMSRRWLERQGLALKMAALWVALEFLRARLFTGFPWNLLGVSQQPLTPVIQVSAWTGVYGVSFLVVYFSVCLFFACGAVIFGAGRPWVWGREAGPALLLGGVIALGGMQRIHRTPLPGPTVRLALIQPSIPQELIWDPDPSIRESRFQKVVALSEEALAEQPEILVWPESALPGLTRENYLAIRQLVRRHRIWMIFGADDAEPVSGDGEFRYFNAGFLLNPEGELVARYHKQHLVVFGEYVPLSDWLPFLRYFTPIQDGFSAGPGPVQFFLGDPAVQISPLICFEDVVPHLARRHVDATTDFLLNLTNDGWFGRSAAQRQHAANAAFRAVENGLPLVRCTNNGLTCWVDAFGQIHDPGFPESSDPRDIHQAGFKVVDIPLKGSSPVPRPTFYRRFSDWFAWFCLGGMALSALGPTLWRRLRHRRLGGDSS